MIDLHLKIFSLTIDLHIDCKCKKHKKSEESAEHVNPEEHPLEEEIFSDVEEVKEEIETPIDVIARQFQEEINKSSNGIYDIPHYSDIPPRKQIQDDVEIITDKFEKEVEDIIEGRR